MRIPSCGKILLAASLLGGSTATPTPNPPTTRSLSVRAFSDAPDGYAPAPVDCPNVDNLVRSATTGVSKGEKDFLKKRQEVTDKALKDFLKRAEIPGLDIDGFFANHSPKVGVAFSGGGYRAMLAGAGSLKAIDSRSPGSTEKGQLGGLLQGSTYLAGLSGGSWLISSMVVNNFTTIGDLQDDEKLWELEDSIFFPEGKLRILSALDYWKDMREEVISKKEAGYDVSITDYWGRALSRQFFNAKDGGPGLTWSSIADTPQFKDAEMPFPIVVADGRNPGEIIISSNATVYEFNPLEFGSFDPQLHAFTHVRYLGTNVTAGKPDNDTCTRGFDNAGFVIGTSSSLFNALAFNLESAGLPDAIMDIAEDILGTLSEKDADIADYTPNPFYRINPKNNPSANTRELTLVDGGLDGQNIPLHPLIQPVREVDVIFAFDNSGDNLDANGEMRSWPNGTALVASYERSLEPKIANGTNFPPVPDVNTFINLELNKRPTFFGCDSKNFTNGGSIPPLLVYIPNAPYTFNSNTSTQKMSYTDEERDQMIDNGWNVATMANSTEWQGCVGCAMLWREWERTNATVPESCKKCMDKHCWNGEIDNKEVVYNPQLIVESARTKDNAGGKVQTSAFMVGAAAVVAGLMAL